MALAVGAPAEGAEPSERLGFAGIGGSNTLLRRLGETLGEELLQALRADPELQVVDRRELVGLLGADRVAELQDCPAEAASCPAGPATRLELTWLLAGRLTGGSHPRKLEVWLARASDGRVVWRNGVPRPGGEAPPFAARLASAVLHAASAEALVMVTPDGYVPVVAPPTLSGHFPDGAWLPLILGTGALITGGFFAYEAAVANDHLHSDAWRAGTDAAGIKAENDRYLRGVVVASSLIGAGALAVAGGLVWMVLGSAGPPRPLPVALLPGPGGLMLSGRF